MSLSALQKQPLQFMLLQDLQKTGFHACVFTERAKNLLSAVSPFVLNP